VERRFHVSSAENRESILKHGLDWTRMAAAPGIAGSSRPEIDGVFLCRDEFEAAWFVGMNNTGGPVDVWTVTGVQADQLVDAGNGFEYFPGRIPPSQVALTTGPPHARAAARRRKGRPGRRS
jgi:hypothetical protein